MSYNFDQYNPVAKYSNVDLNIFSDSHRNRSLRREKSDSYLSRSLNAPIGSEENKVVSLFHFSLSQLVKRCENDGDWRMVEPFGVLSKDSRRSFSLGTRQTDENRNQIVFERTISYAYQSSLSISSGSLHQSTVGIGLWTTSHGFVHLLRCQSRISDQRSRQRIEQEDKPRQKHQSNVFERDLKERDERLL